MLKRYSCAACVALISAGSIAPAYAAEDGSGSMRVSVHVPVSCNLSTETLGLKEKSDFVVGSIFESCNSNRGFQVLASHRPLETGEQVAVRYAGVENDLDASGLSPIVFRAGARHGAIPIAVSSEGLASGLALSFSLTAV